MRTRDLGAMRAVGVVGLLGVALVHLLDVVDKIEETPYIGALYIALTVGAVALAGLLLFDASRRTWAMVAGLTASVLIGFVLSRTSGLPDATGDIGNWKEPLGMASMFVEGCLVALASLAYALSPASELRRLTIHHRRPTAATG